MTRPTTLSFASAVLAAVLATNSLSAQATTPPAEGPPPAGMRHHGPMMGGPRGGSVDERVQRMSGELNLTPEQTARVKALMTTEQRSADSIRAVRALQMETERKAMDARREAHEKALLAILTPEQKAKHEALMKQHDGRGPRGRGTGGMPDRRGRGDSDGRRR
jgi:Spy/CpxP family protein refolding chaperone